MSTNCERVLEVIKQVKPSLENLDENTILNQGAIDSLDIITIVEMLEKEFQINIFGTCLKQENFETANTLTDMIEKICGGN